MSSDVNQISNYWMSLDVHSNYQIHFQPSSLRPRWCMDAVCKCCLLVPQNTGSRRHLKSISRRRCTMPIGCDERVHPILVYTRLVGCWSFRSLEHHRSYQDGHRQCNSRQLYSTAISGNQATGTMYPTQSHYFPGFLHAMPVLYRPCTRWSIDDGGQLQYLLL